MKKAFISKNVDEATKSEKQERLAAIRILICSDIWSESWRGLEQVKEWLKQDREYHEVYEMLGDIIKENPKLPELHIQIRDLLQRMIHTKSKTAVSALEHLPESVHLLKFDADNAYYEGEFKHAQQKYTRIMEIEPNNEYAKDQLKKIKEKMVAEQKSGKPSNEIPLEARKFYRQARSYLAAEDYETAAIFLKAAIDAAKERDMDFNDARELLKEVEHLLSTPKSRPKVFVSYAHKDENFKDELVTMLTPLQNQGILEIWQDRCIEEGDEWFHAIKNAMDTCDFALLLISRYFLASRFIQNEELPSLLQRRKEEGLRIVPIIISDCLWKDVPVLKDILALPKDGKPIVSFNEHNGERDEVWTSIAKIIGERAKKIANEL